MDPPPPENPLAAITLWMKTRIKDTAMKEILFRSIRPPFYEDDLVNDNNYAYYLCIKKSIAISVCDRSNNYYEMSSPFMHPVIK